MAEPLKTQFGVEVVRRLASELSRASGAFDAKAFTRDALDGFEALELLDRGKHLARAMQKHLPGDYDDQIVAILSTLPRKKAPAGGMASFFYLPHTDFVRQFGVEYDRFDTSMRALHALTQVFTGEAAIRPFIERYETRTLVQLHLWTRDPSEHVRRLVSEGSRPRLPWAPRIKRYQHDPTRVLELLDNLKDDTSLYVRRSVANNLNDIGKDHPERLVATAAAWMVKATPERRWIVQHALRSLVKKGDAAALTVLGYGETAKLDIIEPSIAPARPVMGSKVVIALTLQNARRGNARAVVDLIVHFVKANGTTSPKVFKLAVLNLATKASQTVRKTISLADLSTRVHYPGKHTVELQVNGVVRPLGTFTVVPKRTK